MSDINLDFIVANNSIEFTVQPNDITITPTDIQLTVYGAGVGVPGGSSGQLQYNNGQVLGGIANTSYANGNLSLGSVANIQITGGAANYALITNGNGILSWGQVANANTAIYANYANFAGNATIANTANAVAGANVSGIVANASLATFATTANSVAGANVSGTVALANKVANATQSNITSLGTLVGLTVNGITSLGSSSNVKIDGGVNGYVLQTDGTGNLDWTAQTGGGGGNGSPGGANTQVQFNDAGVFGGSAGFTFNKTSNVMSISSANIGNTLINSNGIFTPGVYADITGINFLSAVTIDASADATLGNSVTANYLIGTLTTNAQPNITSVGTLTDVVASGNITTTSTLGYATGAGGTVTQITSRTTGVTLNKPTGKITLTTASLAANTQVQFTLTNSYITATDLVVIQHVSGGTLGLYNVTATAGNGSAVISIRNNSAATSGSQTPVLQFAVIKAVVT